MGIVRRKLMLVTIGTQRVEILLYNVYLSEQMIISQGSEVMQDEVSRNIL